MDLVRKANTLSSLLHKKLFSTRGICDAISNFLTCCWNYYYHSSAKKYTDITSKGSMKKWTSSNWSAKKIFFNSQSNKSSLLRIFLYSFKLSDGDIYKGHTCFSRHVLPLKRERSLWMSLLRYDSQNWTIDIINFVQTSIIHLNCFSPGLCHEAES